MNMHQLQQQQQLQQMLAHSQQQQQHLQQMGAHSDPQPAAPSAPIPQQQHAQPSHLPPQQQAQPMPAVHAPATSAPPNPQLQSLPIRAYLDQTVVPILLDGMYGSTLSDLCCYRSVVLISSPELID
jgi:hypothetical protein